MAGTAHLNADHMYHRTNDASKQKSKDDKLPAKDQSAGCHQLHITAADRSATAYQKQDFQESAHTDQTDQMGNEITSVEPGGCDSNKKQKYIDSKGNFISAPVNKTKGQQR